MARIKGSKLTSKLEFLRKVYGDEMVPHVLEALDPEAREALLDVSLLNWYPSELYDWLAAAICRVAARGDETVYDRMGADTAEQQLSGIYAAFRRDDVV